MPSGGPSSLAYLDEVTVGESPLMARIRAECGAEGLPNVSAQAGAALRTIAAACGAERVLEIGCLLGYSALWLASAGPATRVETVEMDDEMADRAEANFAAAGVADRVTVHRGLALDVLPRLEGPFDLVFLDAAKAEYPEYLAHALRLLRPGGVVAADNVLWGGRVWDPRARDEDTEGIRRFTAALREDSRLATTFLPVGDGLSVTVLPR